MLAAMIQAMPAEQRAALGAQMGLSGDQITQVGLSPSLCAVCCVLCAVCCVLWANSCPVMRVTRVVDALQFATMMASGMMGGGEGDEGDDGDEGDEGGAAPPGATYIRLTEEENAAVERVRALRLHSHV
jgi:hypothetical protein